MRFSNYKVVVTGATSGMGLAATREFISDGATVIGMGRNFKNTKDLGDHFIPLKCNLKDREDIFRACESISETFDGKLDVLVNNAGIATSTTFTDTTPETFDDETAILFDAPIFLTVKLYPLLLNAESGDPNIVVNASIGHRLFDEPFAYSVSKSGVVKYARIAAHRLTGIRINCLSPGIIETPLFRRPDTGWPDEVVDGMISSYKDILPVKRGRCGRPEEAGSLICFLASKDASYMNGADVVIDGGQGMLA